MVRRAILVTALTFCVAQAGFTQPMTAAAVIKTAAEALGMVRGTARRTDSINTVQFSGSGTMSDLGTDGEWTSSEITTATVGMSYSIPAMRWDMERVGADDEVSRTIYVVRDGEAWDERLPGIGATPAMDQVAARLRQIWLTPHGIIRAAVEAEAEAPGSVRLDTQDGRSRLTVEIDSRSFSTILDADNRPERVETTIEHPKLGDTVVVATYADYIDWPKLDVYFPSKITHTTGGHTTLNLIVSSFYQNPYVVFPTPQP